MKKIVLAAVLAFAAVAPASAGNLLDYDPYDRHERYFNPVERFFAPIIDEFERYPRPDAFMTGVDIPDGAGAPIPVDPVKLVGPYAAGQVAVPLETRRLELHDAKGSARSDRRGARSDSRAAW